MIEHLVLFQWAESATEAQIQFALESLRGLKETVPGIVELTCGENFSDRGQGFTHALYVRLESRAALEAYQPHPAHQAVAQNAILPIKLNVIAIDYEI